MNGIFKSMAGGVLPLIISLSLFAQKSQTPDPTGTWKGDLLLPGVELRVVFHIKKGEGSYQATMDSPDQGVTGIAVDTVLHRSDSLFLEVLSVNGNYKGKLSSNDSLFGTWTQNGMGMKLDLGRVENFDPYPQTPEPPYPYRVIDTTFWNEKDSVELAGTVTLPDGEGPFPGVVLVTGSGPQDRNETIMGHQPFLVIADHLTRNGIAVLRYDDRGVGESKGDFSSADLSGLSKDAAAAFEALRGHPDVEASQVGMLGHSEGGMVVSKIGAELGQVGFLVLMASPGLAGDTLLKLQNQRIFESMGGDSAMIAGQMDFLDSLFHVVRNTEDTGQLRSRVSGLFRERIKATQPGISEEKLEKAVLAQTKSMTSDWFRTFIDTDPAEFYSRVDVPVLALFGEKDLQVPPKGNMEPMKEAFMKGGNTRSTLKELEGLNHLFQPAETGLPNEYGSIETTISPKVLDLITDWVQRNVP